MPQLIGDLRSFWADARTNRVAVPDDKLLRAIWSEQTAELLTDLTANDGCKPIKVYWMDNGDTTVEEGTSTNHTAVTCEIDGGVAASGGTEYQITKYLKTTLKVPVKDCGNAYTFDQKFQRQLTEKLVALVNALAGKVPAQLLAFSGVNLTEGKLGTYATLGGGGDDTSLTKVPLGNFNAFDFVPYVQEVAEFNRIINPYVLDGGNLRYAMYNAARQQGTPAGDAGQENHFGDLRAYTDGISFSKNGAGLSDSTFIVDRGAIAMYATAFGPQREDVTGNGFAEVQYRMPLLGLTQPNGGANVPVEVDVVQRRERLPVSGETSRCEDFYVWEMKVWYIILKNPALSVPDGVTGVIRIKSDATADQIGTPMQKAFVPA